MRMLNIVIRTLIIFITLLLLMRLLGKRQLGQLELSELVFSILIADVAAVPLQSADIPLWHGLLPCAVLFIGEFLLSFFSMKSVRLRRLLFGKPCFLVIEGKIQQQMMNACRFTLDELTEELRRHSILDIGSVQYAVLETDGTLNAVLYPDLRPATAGQLNLPAENDGYAVILIEDGAVLKQNLKLTGRNEAWLQKELRRHDCESPAEVYALILYRSGKVYFARKE
ncbi:MAG: DUF421 domain-containing protein [Oscillospiraceae bacterium]|nr:DUF421 domain-containing protein [Oscillospiraceae bacterium]